MTSLRDALNTQPWPLMIPGAFNALVARLVERAGFPAAYVSGAGVANGVFGLPDVGLVTQTEMAEEAGRIAQALRIPVIADADTGFGEADQVARTVQLYERAALAGLHLEDQVFPKRCGHLAGKQVIPVDHMAEKLAAAVAARQNRDFFLIARVDSRSVLGIDDALARAQAYAEAGADAIFPEALETPAEFARFARALPVPVLANMTEFGKTPMLTRQDFADAGVAMVIYPLTGFRVMLGAVRHALETLQATGTQAPLLEAMMTRAELYDLLGYDGRVG